MIFLYRASEGMTIALLPAFFQGDHGDDAFYLDVTQNTWVAVTVLGIFVGKARICNSSVISHAEPAVYLDGSN